MSKPDKRIRQVYGTLHKFHGIGIFLELIALDITNPVF
jgi:hypothetical protein